MDWGPTDIAATAKIASATAARHSMDSPEWYTPATYAFHAKMLMGSIDLDPASHPDANVLIEADRFYTKEDDGMRQPWWGNVFLNPPGGLDDDGEPLVPQFWARLTAMWALTLVQQAIWIGYSLEQLQTLQTATVRGCSCVRHGSPLRFPICYPSKRIAFIENEAKKALRIEKLLAKGKKPNQKSQPSHANYIAYLGPRVDEFRTIFGAFGEVVVPR